MSCSACGKPGYLFRRLQSRIRHLEKLEKDVGIYLVISVDNPDGLTILNRTLAAWMTPRFGMV